MASHNIQLGSILLRHAALRALVLPALVSSSPRIRALLDPANLLELNDLEEMFDQLESWIDCLHAKDRKLHVDRGVPAGQGVQPSLFELEVCPGGHVVQVKTPLLLETTVEQHLLERNHKKMHESERMRDIFS